MMETWRAKRRTFLDFKRRRIFDDDQWLVWKNGIVFSLKRNLMTSSHCLRVSVIVLRLESSFWIRVSTVRIRLRSPSVQSDTYGAVTLIIKSFCRVLSSRWQSFIVHYGSSTHHWSPWCLVHCNSSLDTKWSWHQEWPRMTCCCHSLMKYQ